MTCSAMLLADRRDAVSACVAALRDLRTALYQCPSDDLAGLAGDLAELRALCGAQLAATVAEAECRGVIDASQHAATSAWVADAAWHCRREASTIAKAARVLRRPDMAAAAAAMLTADIDPISATVVAAEYDKLAPDLRENAKAVVLEQFLSVAAEHGPGAVRRLRQEILARYGEEGEFDDHADRCRRQIELTAGRESSAGVWEYRLTTDSEGRAVLEAAIGPLSAPHVDAQSGERDTRPTGLRRGEALIEALRRSVTASQYVPTSPKAVLMLTMAYSDLTGQLGAGTVMGTRAAGTLLPPDTVRRLACDAALIPTVLGTHGEILDQGRAERLFTTAQIRALWLRDAHCTFPGCSAPASWCDAHHLVHWIDGGPTDLVNGALLCPHHHTIVHRDRLAGFVTPQGVSWDERPGSYTRPEGSVGPPHGLASAAHVQPRPDPHTHPRRSDPFLTAAMPMTAGIRASRTPVRRT